MEIGQRGPSGKDAQIRVAELAIAIETVQIPSLPLVDVHVWGTRQMRETAALFLRVTKVTVQC